MKRIVAYLQGGLGNQCFIYAAARALALRSGAALSFNVDLFLEDSVYRRKLGFDSFECRLDLQPVGGKMRRVAESWRSRLVGRYYAGFQNYRCDKRPFQYRAFPSEWKGALVLDGYWQSERYFSDCREQLLRDFRLKNDAWMSSDFLAQRIGNEENSIFLHVRSYKEVPGKSDGQCAIRMKDYYRNALQWLGERLKSGTIFVFSDDLVWARRNVLTADVVKGGSF